MGVLGRGQGEFVGVCEWCGIRVCGEVVCDFYKIMVLDFKKD